MRVKLGICAFISADFRYALVAQWIEQRFPVPRVGGSNPLGCRALSEELIKILRLNLWLEEVLKNICPGTTAIL